MKTAIIGGGAAGYFAAINIREMSPQSEVTIFEAASQSLSKVAISGGGRCNLTNTFAAISDLKRAYPRGARLLKRLFKSFDHRATVEWFEQRGVKLVVQEDECIFPASQSAQQIVDTLTGLAHELDITVKHSHRISLITPLEGGYRVEFTDPKLSAQHFERVVVTTGGSPQMGGFEMLHDLAIEIIPPLPSLFTFNIPHDPITTLMGCVVEGAEVSLVGSKHSAKGALLVTHWGMSGPAVLRLSSYAARDLHEAEYRARIAVNWVGERDTERVREELERLIAEHRGKLVTSRTPYNLPSRLWLAMLLKSGIAHERRFAEVGSRGLNRLVNILTRDEYLIDGQSRFREEFVTCGGVSLASLDPQSCEARNHRGLYFAGEIVDVDAITGGFNLQAAWSMGYAVASAISRALTHSDSEPSQH